MKRIIFVDDEPSVLQGLQRMLYGMRGEWDTSFAGSGQEALDLLERERFDVIVSDMRMPGMDGAQLLVEVRERYPWIVRIVLSGYSDQETLLRSVAAAHQYLSKPCDVTKLKATISRACSLRTILSNESIQRCISTLKSLPSLPALYVELLEELRSSSCSIARVGDVIGSDMGMAAKVLQLVNSAFFGVSRQVSSLSQAVSLLGLETIKALVLSAQIFSQFEAARLPAHLANHLWSHSLATGAYARVIARLEDSNRQTSDHAFMSGLLHDIGKLVLAVNLFDRYVKALDLSEHEHLSLADAELKTLGVTHAEVGGYLLGLWGLPDAIVEGVAFHHCPVECPEASFIPLTAVHVADVLQHEMDLEGTGIESKADVDYLDRLGLSKRFDAWRVACENLNNKGDE
ncbi:MAG: HDOD domain-containing protein [Candidatus Coatesbacteria bacterium]|nr:HDOD domain-containing protein [Candidatus Coatesbacteria bacterium]